MAEWNAWMIGITAVSVIAAIVIYLISQQTRHGETDEQLITEGAVQQEIAEDSAPS